MMLLKIFNVAFISGLSICISASAFEYGYTNTGCKYVKHQHSESSYQHAWCSAHNGIEEYENSDMTRVDCLTKKHAVEFDFANKWAESIGQAEHYALITHKKGKIVLILEDPDSEMIYFNRIKKIARKHHLDAEYITPEILNVKDKLCPYSDCKCHRTRSKQ